MRGVLTLVVACLLGCSKSADPGPPAAAAEAAGPTARVVSDSIDGIPRVTLEGVVGDVALTPAAARQIGQILIDHTEDCRRDLAGKEGKEAYRAFSRDGVSRVVYTWSLKTGLVVSVSDKDTSVIGAVLPSDQAVEIGRQLIEAAK